MKTKTDLQNFFKKKSILAKFNNKPFGSYQKKWMLYAGIHKKDDKNFKIYSELFKEEFSKYDKRFLKKIGLKSVTFVTNLRVDNIPKGKPYVVSASPDIGTSSLILNIGFAYDKEYCRRCIHHELFHIIEWKMHGTYRYEDPKWMKLNPKKFNYGKRGGWIAYTEKSTNDNHPKKGFVSEYAMRAVEEDRAETYSFILTDELNKKLKTWVKGDILLRKKVRLIEKFYSTLTH